MLTNEEFFEHLERMRYAGSFPWERWAINRRRRKQGKPPLP